MRDLLDTVLDAALTVAIALAIGYALLCVGAYSLTAAEQPLTKDEQTIAITLMGEARGEKNAGMYAVACVIQKRATERELTLSQVCLQNKLNKRGVRVWQFSCWNDKPYIETMKRLLKANTKQAKYAKMLARAICKGHGLAQEFTGDANHYHASYVTPYWIKGYKPTKIIGNHLFYKLP